MCMLLNKPISLATSTKRALGLQIHFIRIKTLKIPLCHQSKTHKRVADNIMHEENPATVSMNYLESAM